MTNYAEYAGLPCRDGECTEPAVIDAWCVGHAVARYRTQTTRREPVRPTSVELPVCASDGCENAVYAVGERCRECRECQR